MIAEYLTELVAKIDSERVQVFQVHAHFCLLTFKLMQVLRFLRPDVWRKDGSKVVLVDATKICAHSSITVLEEAVKKVGETNVPLDFLKDYSRDAVLQSRKNGRKKKCAIIPQSGTKRNLYRTTTVAGCCN